MRRPRSPWLRAGLVCGLSAGVLAAAGCGGRGLRIGPGVVGNVAEKDFAISAPRSVAPGAVVLRVHNAGPDEHELIVVRTTDGKLPLRADGLTVDEGRLSRQTAGVLEPGAPGSTRELRFHARPGTYVLFCNMSGHYLGGMRSVLVVR